MKADTVRFTRGVRNGLALIVDNYATLQAPLPIEVVEALAWVKFKLDGRPAPVETVVIAEDSVEIMAVAPSTDPVAG